MNVIPDENSCSAGDKKRRAKTAPSDGSEACERSLVQSVLETYQGAHPAKKAKATDQGEDIIEECAICSEASTHEIKCSGETPHFFCGECFNTYAKTSFEAGGTFSSEQVTEKGTKSPPGDLPCPFFKRDGCKCHAFSSLLLRKHLADDVFELWRLAIGRNAVAKSEKEAQLTAVAQEQVEASRSHLEALGHVFEEALSLGVRLLCPHCSLQGDKDDGCMHIDHCLNCSLSWCYCCGRDLNHCVTCDMFDMFIENNPGYQNRQVGRESQGYGALHEFHRKRILFFLRRLKENVPAELWEKFQASHPNILNNVPTQGRHILWNQIDKATLPRFGLTRECEVSWRHDLDSLILSLREKLGLTGPANLEDSNETPSTLHPALLRSLTAEGAAAGAAVALVPQEVAVLGRNAVIPARAAVTLVPQEVAVINSPMELAHHARMAQAGVIPSPYIQHQAAAYPGIGRAVSVDTLVPHLTPGYYYPEYARVPQTAVAAQLEAELVSQHLRHEAVQQARYEAVQHARYEAALHARHEAARQAQAQYEILQARQQARDEALQMQANAYYATAGVSETLETPAAGYPNNLSRAMEHEYLRMRHFG